MLQSMRKHARYFYVLFFIIIITFVFWGVGNTDKERVNYLAEIGKEKITTEEFWRSYERVRDSYREMYKGQSFDEIEQKLNLKMMVLNSLIEERVLLASADEIGLKVSDAELQQAIVTDPRFMRDGSFKKDIYVRTLAMNRLTPEYYEGVLRNQLAVSKMTRLIVAGIDVNEADMAGIKIDAAKADMVKQMALLGKRKAAVVSYIEGAKTKLNVKIRMDLITS
jgi:peptidyl-prolyl cis-trans isomerase D